MNFLMFCKTTFYCVCCHVHVHWCAQVQVRAQLIGLSFLLLPMWVPGANLGPQSWQSVLYLPNYPTAP